MNNVIFAVILTTTLSFNPITAEIVNDTQQTGIPLNDSQFPSTLLASSSDQIISSTPNIIGLDSETTTAMNSNEISSTTQNIQTVESTDIQSTTSQQIPENQSTTVENPGNEPGGQDTQATTVENQETSTTTTENSNQQTVSQEGDIQSTTAIKNSPSPDNQSASTQPPLTTQNVTINPSITRAPVTFEPPCKELLCPSYLSVGVVINMALAVIRILFCVFVLLLGIKMPPDFMRTVTMAVYIPIGVRETFYFYEEIASYLQQFQNSNKFAHDFLDWTYDVQIAFDEYLQFDFMIMIIIGLHCCRICIRDDESIFVFPVRTIALVLQIVPLFLCLLNLVPGQQNSNVALIIIGFINRLVTIFCFLAITAQSSYSLYLVTQELPYDHAASTDMQIRDARSRLVWFLIYLIIPYLSTIPFFFDAIIWMIQELNGSGNAVNPLALAPGEAKGFLVQCQIILALLKLLVSYYRSTWLIVLTCFFLPPYRRAVPLLCCCLPCCPRITVEPLPRKPKEMSTMYKDA